MRNLLEPAKATPHNNRLRPMPFVHRHGRLGPPFRDFRDRSQVMPDQPNVIGSSLRPHPRAGPFYPIVWTLGCRVARSTPSQKPCYENLSHFLIHFPQSSGPHRPPAPRPEPLWGTPSSALWRSDLPQSAKTARPHAKPGRPRSPRRRSRPAFAAPPAPASGVRAPKATFAPSIRIARSAASPGRCRRRADAAAATSPRPVLGRRCTGRRPTGRRPTGRRDRPHSG